MPIRPVTARVLALAVGCIVVSVGAWAPRLWGEGLLIVSALDYGRRRGDVAIGRGGVDAIVRHGGCCRCRNVNRYHIPEPLSVGFPTRSQIQPL